MGERAPAQTDPNQFELPTGEDPDDGTPEDDCSEDPKDQEACNGQADDEPADNPPSEDPLIDKAATLMRSEGETTLAFLQRRLSVGYARAWRLMSQLEARGVVSLPDETGHRHIKRDGGAKSD